ncbi:MAG TPA: putative Ig domain-containing protein, partial [Gemmatimonadales bacterium]|nr:putative Ig domain-containing protein [Gemmatimonadales bacterium]
MRDIRWLAAALGVALLIQGCGGGDNGPDCDPIAGALVERIEVTPGTATVELGDSLQLTARAYSCEGQLSGLPPFEWTSANPAAVSVSAGGKVFALASASTVQVTASVQGKQGVARITTAQVPVARVEVEPAIAQLGVGRTSTLTARAFDAQGRELEGRVPTWSTSNAAVVAVNQQGEVTGVTVGGPVTITATIEGQSDASLVTVVNNAVATVTVAPGTASIPGGGSVQLSATLRDDQGNVLTGRAVNWTSSDETIATIEGSGTTVTVRGRRAGGPVTITATSEGRSGSAQITVTVGAPAQLAFVQQPPGTITNGGDMPVVSVEVQDAGGNRTTSTAPVTMAIGSGSGGTLSGTTTVNAVSGLATFNDLSITVTSPGTFTLAASSPGLEGATSTAFNVTVPSVTVTTTSLPPATRNSPYSQQLQATGGIGTYSWSVVAGSGALPAGLTLSAAGLLSGTPTAAGTFNFTVRATSGGQSDDQALSLTVNQQGVTVTTTSLPAGTRLVPYSQQLTATGGDGTYTWNLQSGSLPAGITLSSAGVLSGTPTVAGSFNFQVRATSGGQNDNQGLTLVINQPGVIITTTTLPAGTQGAAYSETLTATGGNGTFTWAVVAGSGALPAGITLSGAGVLSGTPTQSGTFNFTVRATSLGLNDEQALSLVIGAPGLVVTTTTLPEATQGSPYSTTLQATGGTGSYAWTLADGNLPGSINLTNDGVLSGTPTQSGTFPITVRVTSGDQVDEQALTLVVNPPPVVIGTTTLPDGTQGAPSSTTLSASGGTGDFTWAVVAGSLPGGITLSAAGALSGTPTASGTFNFTVEASSGGL